MSTAPRQNCVMRSIAIGLLTWLILATGGGFVALAWLGEYGSVAQPLIGATMGALGAVTHGVLWAFPRFQSLSLLHCALANWTCGFLLFLAIAAALTNFGNARFNPDFWPELMRFVLLWVGCPMLALSVLVAALTSPTQPPRGLRPDADCDAHSSIQ